MAAAMLDVAQAMAATPEVDRFFETGSLPDSFFALLGRFYALYDEWIAENLKADRDSVSCALGCARCCDQLPAGLYAFETLNIHRLERGTDGRTRRSARLLDDALVFQELVEAAFGEDGDIPADHPCVNEALERYPELRRACAFLEDGRCGIYAHRPVSCRMYHSRGAPSLCTSAGGANFHVDPPPAVDRVLWELSGRLAFDHSDLLAPGLVVLDQAAEAV